MKLERSKDQNILKNKKLLLLGGSRNDIEFIKAAHSLGAKVGVTDWYTPEKSPAKLVADEYFDVSVSDIDALEKLVKENGYNGVLTGFSDSYLEYYAELCERCNLPSYGTKEQLHILTNKNIYKDLFNKYKVPTLPNYDINELDEDFNDFPIVLKPVDGSGGRGLQIVREKDQLEKAIFNSTGSSKQGKVVIEPFIEERRELTAFFIFIDGRVYYPGSANRFLSKAQGDKIGIPILYTLQSSEDGNFRKNVLPYMKKMFEDLEIKDGILFAQCIIDGENIYVYDVGYRATGTLEYKLFERLYGINTMEMLVHHALTGSMNFYNIENFEDILHTDRVGINITIQGKQGVVKEIRGVEEILAMPEIIDLQVKTAPGDEITEEMIGTLAQIVVRIFLTGDNLGESLNIVKKVYDKLEIIDQDGENMILDTIDFNDVYEMYKK